MKITNTKEKILETSLELFSAKSFSGASIREIAKNTGIRESAIYNHFSSKDEILNKIIDEFSKRNFGSIILTDELLNLLSKPEKFFLLFSNNLLNFWNSNDERMFIKILMSENSGKNNGVNYTLEDYLFDFEKLCGFIFKEMINYNLIKKEKTNVLSKEFLSPLFLVEVELICGTKTISDYKSTIERHVKFFWSAVKN
ncbi:MAG: TetR/AcrR family transcriptional regulator [Ignavibacteriae bacterium]|nr:TetR/AcrR family transcriptional regulator [Ignavibacteriota bacterium]